MSYMMKKWQSRFTFFGWIASSCLSSVGLGQSLELKVDIRPIIQQDEIQVHDIKAISSFATRSQDWANGMIGDFKPGQFMIQLQHTKSNIAEYGLRLRFEKQQVALGRCKQRDCSWQPPSAEREIMESNSDAVWKFIRYGSACLQTDICEVFLPSWSLTRMLQSGGSIQKIPDFAILIQHQKGLSLFDARNSKRFLNWPSSAIQGLGLLKRSHVSSDGVMSLEFASGVALVDFVHDRVIVARSTGLFLHQGTVSEWGKQHETPLHLNELGDKSIRLLFADSRYVAWSHGYLQFKSDVPSESEGVSLSPFLTARIAGVSRQGEDHVFLLSEGSRLVSVPVHKVGSSDDSVNSIALKSIVEMNGVNSIGGFPVTLTRQKQLRVADNGLWQASSLGDRKQVFAIHNEGAVVLLESTAGAACTMTHFWMHPNSPRSYKNSGIQIPCGTLSATSGGPGFGSLAALIDGVLHVSFVFRP